MDTSNNEVNDLSQILLKYTIIEQLNEYLSPNKFTINLGTNPFLETIETQSKSDRIEEYQEWIAYSKQEYPKKETNNQNFHEQISLSQKQSELKERRPIAPFARKNLKNLLNKKELVLADSTESNFTLQDSITDENPNVQVKVMELNSNLTVNKLDSFRKKPDLSLLKNPIPFNNDYVTTSRFWTPSLTSDGNNQASLIPSQQEQPKLQQQQFQFCDSPQQQSNQAFPLQIQQILSKYQQLPSYSPEQQDIKPNFFENSQQEQQQRVNIHSKLNISPLLLNQSKNSYSIEQNILLSTQDIQKFKDKTTNETKQQPRSQSTRSREISNTTKELKHLQVLQKDQPLRSTFTSQNNKLNIQQKSLHISSISKEQQIPYIQNFRIHDPASLYVPIHPPTITFNTSVSSNSQSNIANFHVPNSSSQKQQTKSSQNGSNKKLTAINSPVQLKHLKEDQQKINKRRYLTPNPQIKAQQREIQNSTSYLKPKTTYSHHVSINISPQRAKNSQQILQASRESQQPLSLQNSQEKQRNQNEINQVKLLNQNEQNTFNVATLIQKKKENLNNICLAYNQPLFNSQNTSTHEIFNYKSTSSLPSYCQNGQQFLKSQIHSDSDANNILPTNHQSLSSCFLNLNNQQQQQSQYEKLQHSYQFSDNSGSKSNIFLNSDEKQFQSPTSPIKSAKLYSPRSSTFLNSQENPTHNFTQRTPPKSINYSKIQYKITNNPFNISSSTTRDQFSNNQKNIYPETNDRQQRVKLEKESPFTLYPVVAINLQTKPIVNYLKIQK